MYSTATGLEVASCQTQFVKERLSGMSRGMVNHIFEEVDRDGNGEIDYEELDMLAPYFSSVAWTPEVKAAMFTEMDKDAGGSVCADEFYEWMIESAQLEVSAEGVTKMKQREERLKISTGDVPAHLMEIIEESGAKTIEQKVTHALHSGFDRTIADHFISCYLLLKEWGCDDDVCVAGLLHASYRRGDGLQAVKPSTMRPVWQEKLGAGAEELIYLFPSAHKTAYASDGLLHAPLGSTISFPDLLDDGKTITIDDKQRAALAELEVVNSHDQNFLCNDDPVQNLWQFYQHVTIMPLLSAGAAATIKTFQQRAFCAGVDCSDIVKWHEGRFGEAGPDAKWQAHIEMFKPGGRYYDIEKILLSFVDEDGYTGDGCDAFASYQKK